MKIILSAAVSLDGYIDDDTPNRLKLSNPEDWENVLSLRGECDAILVGAETVRRDDPSLVIRDESIRRARLARGQSADIVKVTVTSSGRLEPEAKFFTEGNGLKLVFATDSADSEALRLLEPYAEIIRGDKITAAFIESELSARGYDSLLVEGGGGINTMFLEEGVVDELRYAVAPFFVGGVDAPRFLRPGVFPWNKDRRIELSGVEKLGDMAVMTYVNRNRMDKKYILMAIEASRNCVPSHTCYCVGAVVVTASGEEFVGYTHETDPQNHAEEEAVLKAIRAGANLKDATIYASMEPCSKRSSKEHSCSAMIIEYGFSRVVYALAEPDHFVVCQGDSMLQKAGIDVTVLDEYASMVEDINSHVLGR